VRDGANRAEDVREKTRVNSIVGISEMAVSNRDDDVLVTYSLGSCIGVTLYDPVARVGGLIHCMLPLSKLDPEKARARPCMFADTGLVALIQAVLELGGRTERLIAKAAGAASLLDEQGLFRIGERNHTVMRKVLWKNNILIAAEDVGGTLPRTVYLHMASGTTTLKTGGREFEL
jgi:chemotaxis protein CheD